MGQDLYQVLGVGRGASQEEIQAAYRRLARRHHPDVSADADAEDRFKRINEAYAVLSDPQKRARYDRYGESWRDAPRRPADGSGRFGADARGHRVHVRTARARPFGSGDAWADLFGAGLGGFGSTRGRGADTELDLELSVEDAYTGGRRDVIVSAAAATQTHTQTYEVRFPPGVTNGTRIRVAGLGDYGRGGAADGDLYLVVRLAPHPRYRVDERDVTVDLAVTPWEAALGATVAVGTPTGPARVTLPAGSSSGRRLRLRGHGLPNPDGPPGDLYAAVKIVVPEQLSPEERRLFQRLARRSRFDPRSAG